MKHTVRIVLFVLGLLSVIWVTKRTMQFDFRQFDFLSTFSILLTLSVIAIGFVIFLENRHPTQTLTWLVVLGSFPIVGFLFYLLFGRNYRRERMYRKKYFLDKQAFHQFDWNQEQLDEQFAHVSPHQRKLFMLAQRLGNSPISFLTASHILTNGEETFDKIFESLKAAKHHIHLEYYIVRHDSIGERLKDILMERAKAGVKVRFLFDAVGSWRLSNRYIRELREAGVEVIAFGPVQLPFLNSKLNFRNHRKIIIVDGKVGFVGGLNIGEEYMGLNKHFGFWRDTHVYVKGEAVRTLQLIFLQDWYYMTNDNLLLPEYLDAPLDVESKHGGVQILASGPDNEWSVIKNIFFAMITSAKKSVYIASPYFIPDEDIFTSLKIAALSGMDVRLLVPKTPDKWIVYFASRSYFHELLESGVKIYEYEKGFMHSKTIMVDEELASIGTSNMDMRSFHLNFEVNAFLYRTHSTSKLIEDFKKDLLHSRPLHEDEFIKRPFWRRVLESTSRLLSPLL
ncbi:cardiolipin synthase [Bacillus fonticola]|uniref:cardiolipin synthase n=1 Tax=Bacillus fonticola TaxID=2728853 RepID=UPI0014731685|nr:cardiolipin synthase [Bacillus fonticola]